MQLKMTAQLHLWLTTTILALTDRIAATGRTALDRTRTDHDDDRGDVPGWVMITVMTAIVVIALLTVFQNEVTTAVKNAFDSVSGSGKK